MLVVCLATCVRVRAQIAPLALKPAGIAYDAAGNLYIADMARNQVLEQTVGGALLVLAGTGEQGFAGDGGVATAALLNAPQAIAVDRAGIVYVADTGNARVRSISTNGTIQTIAGTGVRGFSGDGGAAASAQLRTPVGLTVLSDGSLLVSDAGNQRVRKIAPGGIITTFAGVGAQGFGGDGGPAVSALLDGPEGVAALSDGRVVIADSRNHRLRIVATDGTITTLAGTGVRGYSGDGGAAAAAELSLPRGVLALSDGSIVFADANNQRLRQISAQGIITTVAASGTQGAATDGAVANAAAANNMRGVAASPYGALAFADSSNRVIRALLGDGDVYHAAAMSAGRNSQVALTATAATASVAITGQAATPRGVVQLLDGASLIATANLNSSGAASFSLTSLTPGAHSLTAQYLGDGFNPAATSSVVTLTIVGQPAATTTTLSSIASSYAGMPMTLRAQVAAAQGTPTGAVSFLDAGSVVAQAQLSGGSAVAVWLNAAAGSHSLVASYGGDANFSASASTAQTAIVNLQPDFSIATSGSANQTLPVGSVANYTLGLTSISGVFSGAVALSASGLPSGVTVTFAPPQVVPGAGGATTVMSFPTDKLLAQSLLSSGLWYAIFLPLGALSLRRRYRRVAFASLLIGLAGCGARTVPDSSLKTKQYAITVTGTGTNLAGAIVTHSATVQLTVE